MIVLFDEPGNIVGTGNTGIHDDHGLYLIEWIFVSQSRERHVKDPREQESPVTVRETRVNQRAKLTRVLGKTALKSFHSRLCKIRYFATAFFKQAINNNGFPDKVVMDKSGANYAGLANINLLLILAGFATMIDICQVKYLNNIIEQDHQKSKERLVFRHNYPAKAINCL
jgi:hypothetical protein